MIYILIYMLVLVLNLQEFRCQKIIEEMFLFAICLFLYVSALVFYTTYWKRRHLPAGPTPLPILGKTDFY